MFVAIAGAGAFVAVLLRPRPELLRPAASLALGCCLLAAVLLPPETSRQVGSGWLAGTPLLRIWLILASASFLGLHLLATAAGWQRNLPAAMLGGLAAIALAIGVPDAAAGATFATAGGFLAALSCLVLPLQVAGARLGADLLRIPALALLLLVPATALPAVVAGDVELGISIAIAAVAGASILRGSIPPLHRVAVTAATTAPVAALPLLLAWMPAAFLLVAVEWRSGLGSTAGVELLLVGLGLATIVYAAIGCFLQRDAALLIVYSTAQDAGFVLFALAAPAEASGSSLEAARIWLPLFAAAKAGGWALVIGLLAAGSSSRMDDLQGWARRTPLLALALLVLLIGNYGLPGLLPFEARRDLVAASMSDGVGLVVVGAASILPVLAFLRLLLIGLRAGEPPRPEADARSGTGKANPEVEDDPVTRDGLRVEGTPKTPDAAGVEQDQPPGIGRTMRSRLATARAQAIGLALSLPGPAAVAALPARLAGRGRSPSGQERLTAVVALLLALLPFAVALGVGDLGAAAAGPGARELIERLP